MNPPPSASAALRDYVRAVERIVDSGVAVPDAVRQITDANHAHLGHGYRLPDPFRAMAPGVPYTRNLIHADDRRRFVIMAVVWPPFQETRVHDHLNWCVVNVLEGCCHAVEYERLDDGTDPAFADLRIRESKLVPAGSVTGLLPPPRSNIHRMANASREVAISLHTYGDPGRKARVFDPASGEVAIVDLVFNNQ